MGKHVASIFHYDLKTEAVRSSQTYQKIVFFTLTAEINCGPSWIKLSDNRVLGGTSGIIRNDIVEG
jgi:hypothetical protein